MTVFFLYFGADSGSMGLSPPLLSDQQSVSHQTDASICGYFVLHGLLSGIGKPVEHVASTFGSVRPIYKCDDILTTGTSNS